MTTTDELGATRTRRAEPITRHTARNGAVSYRFQADVAFGPTAPATASDSPFARLPKRAANTGESPPRWQPAHS